MAKIFFFNLIPLFVFNRVLSQTQPVFFQFMHNKLAYNAGFAGSSDMISGSFQYNRQWVNFEGPPQSFNFSTDMPIPSKPIGVGLSLINDQIGAQRNTFVAINAAYKTKIRKGNLGLGLNIGFNQLTIKNANWINPLSPYPGTSRSNYSSLGLGAYYEIPKKAYLGLSVNNLLNHAFQNSSPTLSPEPIVYLMAGFKLSLTPWVTAQPNILLRAAKEFKQTSDLNLNFLWANLFLIGVSYRTDNTTAILAAYQSKFGVSNASSARIGYAYAFVTSRLAGYSRPTHEITLSFSVNTRK